MGSKLRCYFFICEGILLQRWFTSWVSNFRFGISCIWCYNQLSHKKQKNLSSDGMKKWNMPCTGTNKVWHCLEFVFDRMEFGQKPLALMRRAAENSHSRPKFWILFLFLHWPYLLQVVQLGPQISGHQAWLVFLRYPTMHRGNQLMGWKCWYVYYE